MNKQPLSLWFNKYTLTDAFVALLAVVVPVLFLMWLPKHVTPALRFAIGIPFGLALLGVYFKLLRKSDRLIEAELTLSRAIAVLKEIANGSEKLSMRPVEKHLKEIMTLVAAISANILKEGVSAYEHEIQYLLDVVESVNIMVSENQPDKQEMSKAITTLEGIAEKVKLASDERVARAKAKLDFIHELQSKRAEVQQAVGSLREVLDKLDKEM